MLHLRPGAREWFLGWLREAHPDLVPRYAELYGRGAYARKDYQARIAGQVRDLADRFGVGRGAGRPGRRAAARTRRPRTGSRRDRPPHGMSSSRCCSGPHRGGPPAALEHH